MIYTLTAVHKVIDGDSLNVACLSRPVRLEDEHTELLVKKTLLHCRVVTLDTPERGQPGYTEATADLRSWLVTYGYGAVEHRHSIELETYGRDRFGRMLTDFYVAGDRGNTLSQWMLRERGWLPWTG